MERGLFDTEISAAPAEEAVGGDPEGGAASRGAIVRKCYLLTII